MRSWKTLLLVAASLLPTPLFAHTLSVSHVNIAVPESGAIVVELDLSIRDLALTIPLDPNGDERITWGELTRARPALEDLVHDGFSISSGSSTCTTTFSGLKVRRYDEGAYAAVELTAHCPSLRDLSARYDFFFQTDPQHRAIVTFDRSSSSSTSIASRSRRHLRESAEDSSSTRNSFFDFFRQGVHHILIGYDHLAFLISLLLPAALSRESRKWRPLTKIRPGISNVVGLITAFTVAHSITLTAAALNWIEPASRWVEIVIALSVLFAALNNVWPIIVRRLWAVAFAFGLVHGFGFAGALSEIGLPDGSKITALAGFNLGVEFGQLTVAAIALPLLFAVSKYQWYSRLAMPIASVLIALLAATWAYGRLQT